MTNLPISAEEIAELNAAAARPVKNNDVIDVVEVVVDDSIYPRAEWSQSTVSQYAEALEAGERFPPIVLESDTNRLLDGMHRLRAHREAGRETIKATWIEEIPEGIPAKLYAASLSTKHGDRIKGDDLKVIAREITGENPDFDQKTIAKYSGVTQSTVSKWVRDITERRNEVRRIRCLLLARVGWTQQQIADQLGVTQKTVSNDIRGNIVTERLGEDMLRDAADDLPVDVDDILEDIREERIFSQWSDDERQLLKRLRVGETVVVSMRSHDGLISWAESAGLYVRIDRKSKWGNPFELPDDGDRETVIRNYADHYLPNKPSLQKDLGSLVGKALGCWCAPEACHGDVLKEASRDS